MKTLQDATALALRVRAQFAAFERATLGREWTNADLAAGLCVDSADLLRLVMAKEGLRSIEGADEKLRHELCDVLWSVLVLAGRYSVDLTAAFPQEMSKLETLIRQKLAPPASP